jgi:hypothetical protein
VNNRTLAELHIADFRRWYDEAAKPRLEDGKPRVRKRRRGASSVVNLLNSYFGAVASVIHAHNGFIDKYICDGVMAFWIPPFSAGDAHASDACLAALAQQEAMGALRAIINRAAISAFGRNPDINGIVEQPSLTPKATPP